MDYDKKTLTHELKQYLRIAARKRKIEERIQAVAEGRVVPDNGDLPIGTGRRLQAAVLFLDICGFSDRLSESIDEQEANLRAMTLFFGEMIAIIEEYDGTVEKNTGDGLMAYFRATGGNEPSEAQKAVGAALTMFDAAQRYINPTLNEWGIDTFDFRIGIEHGSITIADVGKAGGFRGIVAIGTTANVACKMLKVAGKNEIVVGDRLAAQLPPSWQGWTRVATGDTGWVYRATQDAYPFHRYTGRWKHPNDRSGLLGG